MGIACNAQRSCCYYPSSQLDFTILLYYFQNKLKISLGLLNIVEIQKLGPAEQAVLEDFKGKINSYLEIKSKELKQPKNQMSKYAIETFSKVKCETLIRDAIDNKFKFKHAVKMAKKSHKKQRLRKRIGNTIIQKTVRWANDMGNPILEVIIWALKEDAKKK